MNKKKGSKKRRKPKDDVDRSPPKVETHGIQIVDSVGYPVLQLSENDYRHYVKHMKLTKTQEDELLNELFGMVAQFVNMGFGIEPMTRLKLNSDQKKANGCPTKFEFRRKENEQEKEEETI